MFMSDAQPQVCSRYHVAKGKASACNIVSAQRSLFAISSLTAGVIGMLRKLPAIVGLPWQSAFCRPESRAFCFSRQKAVAPCRAAVCCCVGGGVFRSRARQAFSMAGVEAAVTKITPAAAQPARGFRKCSRAAEGARSLPVTAAATRNLFSRHSGLAAEIRPGKQRGKVPRAAAAAGQRRAAVLWYSRCQLLPQRACKQWLFHAAAYAEISRLGLPTRQKYISRCRKACW